MQKKPLILALLVSLTLPIIQPAYASLNSSDYSTDGDGLLTVDTDTGLEWLDLTATNYQSVNSVLGGYGGYIQDGFRYATTNEVLALLTHAGITHFDGVLRVQDWQGTQLIHDLFGITNYISPNDPYYSWGMSELDYGYQAAHLTFVTTKPFGGDMGGGARFESYGQAFSAEDHIGSFLVRVTTPVPEPQSWTLLLTGLAAMGLFIRKRL
jgi:hypothetical protein